MFDFATYMKSIAEKHKLISHSKDNPRFFRINGIGGMEDFLIQNPDGTILMIDINRSGYIQDAGNQNFADRQTLQFFVFSRGVLGDADLEESIRKATKQIAFNIMGKMKMDKFNARINITSNGLADLDLRSVRYESIGPVADWWIGTMVTFGLITSAITEGMKYDESDWNI